MCWPRFVELIEDLESFHLDVVRLLVGLCLYDSKSAVLTDQVIRSIEEVFNDSMRLSRIKRLVLSQLERIREIHDGVLLVLEDEEEW